MAILGRAKGETKPRKIMIEWTTISLFGAAAKDREEGTGHRGLRKTPRPMTGEAPDTIQWLNFQVDDHSRKSFGFE